MAVITRDSGSTVDPSFYDRANLFPCHTGLPFVVWIPVCGGAKHDVRVKVTQGSKAQPTGMISVALRPGIHVVDDEMDGRDFAMLSRWIELNRDTILQYWHEEIDTVDAMSALKAISC